MRRSCCGHAGMHTSKVIILEEQTASGRRRSRATVAEDEATHVADTGATGAHGGGRHEAKRRCTVSTASMATAATSDAEAKAAQRAGTANKREAQSRDEGTESDSEARNPRGTRVQEHLPTQPATQNTDASQRRRVERPKPRARKARRPQQHANETRNATARTGRKRGIQPTKLSICGLISDAARARRPDNMQIHHLQQTNPSADVSQKLLNTAPERKGRTQDVDSCGIHADRRNISIRIYMRARVVVGLLGGDGGAL